MSCRWVASDQPRMVRGRHGDVCPETAWRPPLVWADCDGCQPCPEPHCLVQWHGDRGDCETHAVTVCPSCVGKVREHLAEIVRLSGLPLVDEVLTLGEDDTEAADLLGPVAHPAQWRQRGTYGHAYHPDTRLGELHPYWVLGTWDLLVTEHLGHNRTQRVGVTSSAAYLASNLTYLAADIEFDFAPLAEEAAACRAHLERVLHDGEQRDRGAPCMTCGAILEQPNQPGRRCSHSTPAREWLAVLSTYPEIPVRNSERAAASMACGECDQGGRQDGWHCTRCRESSTEDQYRFAVAHLHREEATHLTDRDMEVRTGVKAGTVRVWALRGLVGRRQDSGRTLYDVADVVREAEKRGLIRA